MIILFVCRTIHQLVVESTNQSKLFRHESAVESAHKLTAPDGSKSALGGLRGPQHLAALQDDTSMHGAGDMNILHAYHTSTPIIGAHAADVELTSRTTFLPSHTIAMTGPDDI